MLDAVSPQIPLLSIKIMNPIVTLILALILLIGLGFILVIAVIIVQKHLE